MAEAAHNPQLAARQAGSLSWLPLCVQCCQLHFPWGACAALLDLFTCQRTKDQVAQRLCIHFSVLPSAFPKAQLTQRLCIHFSMLSPAFPKGQLTQRLCIFSSVLPSVLPTIFAMPGISNLATQCARSAGWLLLLPALPPALAKRVVVLDRLIW